MDNEVWRWIWVAAALILGFAEIVTAGFFMLPFAVGAAVAAVLAWLDVAPLIQLLVFLGVSVVVLVLLQRFVRRADQHQPAIGANRLVGQRAHVLEAVDRATGEGRVRFDTEMWRATTDGERIEEGAEVTIVGIRGTRVVVQRSD